MAGYKVEIKKSAFKEIQKLDKSSVPHIFQKIESLSHNPRPTQAIKIKGSQNSYRLRVGVYRIIYQINEKDKMVIVFAVGHRKDIYRRG